MDKIFIQNLAVRGKHGVKPEEWVNAQEFVLDITVDFETVKAATSDDLSDTIDYDFFRNSAKEVVEGTSFHLLEKLADADAQKVLANTRIKTVTITIRKTEMYPDCTPGVTVIRTRAFGIDSSPLHMK